MVHLTCKAMKNCLFYVAKSPLNAAEADAVHGSCKPFPSCRAFQDLPMRLLAELIVELYM